MCERVKEIQYRTFALDGFLSRGGTNYEYFLSTHQFLRFLALWAGLILVALKNFDVRICCSKKIIRVTNFSNDISFNGYHPILQIILMPYMFKEIVVVNLS